MTIAIDRKFYGILSTQKNLQLYNNNHLAVIMLHRLFGAISQYVIKTEVINVIFEAKRFLNLIVIFEYN